jgi:hypothetical protein
VAAWDISDVEPFKFCCHSVSKMGSMKKCCEVGRWIKLAHGRV